MPHIECDVCNSTDIIKQNGEFTCRGCGCKYSADEMKRIFNKNKVETASEKIVLTDNIQKEDDDDMVTYEFLLTVILPIIIIASLLVFSLIKFFL